MDGHRQARAARKSHAPHAPDAPDERGLYLPAAYLDLTAPRQRARDRVTLARLDARAPRVDMRARGGGEAEIRIYTAAPHDLDALTPLLHNLGLPAIDQNLFDLSGTGPPRFIRSFIVRAAADAGARETLPQESLIRETLPRAALLRALAALLTGEAADDSLNRLILRAGLDWREVDLLRAYCSYYLQLGGRIGRTRLHEALLRETRVARLLFVYFDTRFRPGRPARERLDALADGRQRLIEAFETVADATDDGLLRDLFNLIDATLRANFHSPGATAIALKIDSLGVMRAPAPRPFVEIYVHRADMQGLHLRGAKVARGGVRWSDRPHDLRTEILGLMQTQMVKNALIAPQGAKGGFALTAPAADPAAREAQGKAAYRAFIGALLDLTDNRVSGKPEPARGVVAYDDPDPYLVVAADKGTAGWSDLANEIARARGFWLGDAFATGGSNGYHHKRLGITARGAWVCARRHFLEMGRDIDSEPITVVGVGSMDGDVFGNGMLLSDKMRLLGAFSGAHVFIDPIPDPAVSWAERRRLFDMPRSSWDDYDRAKISPGGGVWRRDARDIALSPQARDMLGARHRLLDGEALIRLLLAAPVDLLWMGGVGTYVKARDESDEAAADRANDGARIDAGQLRAAVVAEGANLGFTMAARVDYALRGGRIDTDAVDNSAGVDLSDHEVNLKILLRNGGPAENGVAENGPAETGAPPDLLQSLTDEVCAAVLDDNARQSLCLSLEQARAAQDVAPFLEVADRFEAAGRLDRRAEGFPTRKEALARGAKGLTRPELSVLMAYAKLTLKRALLEAPDFLGAAWTRADLEAYFPPALRWSHAAAIAAHPLAREITATVVSNRIVDRAGARFLLFGDPLAPGLLIDAAGLYLFFDAVLEGPAWRAALRRPGCRMTPAEQYDGLRRLEEALADLCRAGLARGLRLRPDRETVDAWRAHLRDWLASLTPGAAPTLVEVIASKAARDAFLARLRDFPFLVDLARASGCDIGVAARLFDAAAAALGLRELAAQAAQAPARDAWEARLLAALDGCLRAAPARVAARMLQTGADAPDSVFARAGLTPQLALLQKLRAELIGEAPKTVAPYALFAAELTALVDAVGGAGRRA